MARRVDCGSPVPTSAQTTSNENKSAAMVCQGEASCGDRQQAGQRISTPEGTAVAVYQSTGAPGQMQSRPEIEKPALKQGAQDVGLFVLGGASTVCEGPVKMPSMDDFAGHVAATHVALDMPEVAVELEPANKQPALAPVVRASLVPRSDCLTDDSSGKSNGGKLRGCFNGFITSCKEVVDICMLYPTVIIVPLLVFALLCGLGIWGVTAGANAYVQQQKDDVRSRAVDAVTGFQIQLQQSFTPGLTFQLLVKQRPDVGYWFENFNATAQELMSRVPNGSLWNLQLQPFAQVMMINPFRPAMDASQVNPPRDLLADPARRNDIMKIITTREPLVVGPVLLSNVSWGTFVRYPIYIKNVDWNETFGFRYIHSNWNGTREALPYSMLPASVRNCTEQGPCYNFTTREKWWGVMTVLINYDAVTSGNDAYLANLRKLGFYYALVRPLNATAEQVIAQVGPSSLRDHDSVTVDVKVFTTMWQLRVAPQDGFEPSWRAALIAAVVIIAFIIAALLFVALASFRRQRLLLQETVAANRNLAETTKRLEEEKERMDVLLVRQYDLLRCLDANRSDGKINVSDTVGSSKKAMMARIEDARRSLNVAKSAVEDPIQVFEVLGAGAFGKVQKGLWRGTVVAVKTMILPANMTGQQKREKMAVMEAAISSSLVHPNIVTTYTYFIRPYHEPTHEAVQNMLAQGEVALGKISDSRTSLDDSTGDSSTIHSYEVRLVLEFCDKGSLKDALDQSAFMQGGALNLAAMLETAADVAKAMVHMHAANVLHSDLKARNIMLKSSGTEGRGIVAKVADFGLSTRMEHQETHLSSCFQGTLTHMAPEVMLEGRISKAADVYSFGILLWELFCAGDPFQGVPRAHLGHAITKEARRPKFPPFAPAGFVRLATRCWDPDASQRPMFEEVLSELVRMREELGGETPQLVVTPPKPITHEKSVESGPRITASQGAEQLGVATSGFHIASGGASTLLSAGIVLGGVGGSTHGSIGSLGGSIGARSGIKSSIAQRHLRKLGIKLGGMGGSGLAPALPALHEAHEDREEDGAEAEAATGSRANESPEASGKLGEPGGSSPLLVMAGGRGGGDGAPAPMTV